MSFSYCQVGNSERTRLYSFRVDSRVRPCPREKSANSRSTVDESATNVLVGQGFPRRERRPSAVRRLSAVLYKAIAGDDQGVSDAELSSANANIRYRPESLNQLCKSTKFSKKELQLMYRGFKQGCPNGVVTLEQFKEIYAQFFPHGHKSNADTGRYAVYVFNTFDRDKNGHINFEEFVLGLSVLSRGTREEKLRWVFDLYDVDQDGLLTKEDIQKVVGSMYEMMGNPTDPPIEEHTVENHIDYVFNKMDENGDGSITVQEFLEACSHDDSICQSLALFDTILTSAEIELPPRK